MADRRSWLNGLVALVLLPLAGVTGCSLEDLLRCDPDGGFTEVSSALDGSWVQLGLGTSDGTVTEPIAVESDLDFRRRISLNSGRGTWALSQGGDRTEAFAPSDTEICYFTTERFRCEENKVPARPMVCLGFERRGNRLIQESTNGRHAIYGPS